MKFIQNLLTAAAVSTVSLANFASAGTNSWAPNSFGAPVQCAKETGGCGSGETCCGGLTCQWAAGGHRLCLTDQYCVGNEAGCGAGERCCNGLTCQWAPGHHRRCYPRTPPKITSCSRRAYKLYYEPDVGPYATIEMIKASDHKEKRTVRTEKGTYVDLSYGLGQWFHSWRYGHFYVRFIKDGVPGPTTLCTFNTPLGLDLNKDGSVDKIAMENGLTIDVDGDGVEETLTEWFGPEEGILLDVSTGIPSDGKVTGVHMFGQSNGKFLHGYEKLAATHDLDGNGVVEGEGELASLKIWKDANSNGRVDAGELADLVADYGILSLMTSHEDFKSTAALADGEGTMVMEDLFFGQDA